MKRLIKIANLSIFLITSSLLLGTQSSASGNLSLQRMQQILSEDLKTLESMNFSDSTSMSKTFFGPKLSGKTLINFIQNRIHHFTVSEKSDSAAARTSGDTMTLYPSYFSLDPEERMGFLIHEARHGGNAFFHVNCPKPFTFKLYGKDYAVSVDDSFSGTDGCDGDNQGAYAVQGTFYANVALYCTNCDPSLKKRASVAFVTDGLIRIIDPQSAEAFVEGNVLNLDMYLPSIQKILRKLEGR